MKDRKHNILLLFIGLLYFSCTQEKEVIQEYQTGNIIYELDTLKISPSNLNKTKQKSSTEFHSILYSDLYKKNIPSSALNDISILSLANGDKQLLNELILSSYANDSAEVKIPSNSEMRDDLDKFVIDTYVRFFLRPPSDLEKNYFITLIQNDPTITPEIVYFSFASSNEYQFY